MNPLLVWGLLLDHEYYKDVLIDAGTVVRWSHASGNSQLNGAGIMHDRTSTSQKGQTGQPRVCRPSGSPKDPF